MNKDRWILLLFALIGAYFLGYFQITPAFIVASVSTKTAQPAATAKTQKVTTAPVSQSSAQPTPYPPPPDWSGR